MAGPVLLLLLLFEVTAAPPLQLRYSFTDLFPGFSLTSVPLAASLCTPCCSTSLLHSFLLQFPSLSEEPTTQWVPNCACPLTMWPVVFKYLMAAPVWLFQHKGNLSSGFLLVWTTFTTRLDHNSTGAHGEDETNPSQVWKGMSHFPPNTHKHTRNISLQEQKLGLFLSHTLSESRLPFVGETWPWCGEGWHMGLGSCYRSGCSDCRSLYIWPGSLHQAILGLWGGCIWWRESHCLHFVTFDLTYYIS